MNEEIYQPDGVHDNFQVYSSKPEPKKKEYYRFINKNGDKIGHYHSVYPERTAKKVLRKIFYNTGIDNHIRICRVNRAAILGSILIDSAVDYGWMSVGDIHCSPITV